MTAAGRSAGRRYTPQAFARTTGNVRDGYFGFRPTATGTYNVFGGFRAPGQDAWVGLDDVRLDGPCAVAAHNSVDG